MEPTTIYSDEAEGPAGASAHRIATSDGVKIRVAGWKVGDRGTVIIFNGRNEFVEKYGRVASDLAKAGYSTASLDWRSQGL